MSAPGVALTVLFVTACVYIWIAGRRAGLADHPWSFFHDSAPSRNTYGLIAANISLGTGVAYLIQGGHQHGIAMLLVPLALYLGYRSLAILLQTIRPGALKESNFLRSVDFAIEAETGNKSRVGLLVTVALIGVYTLILSFEIFASSKLISTLLFQTSSAFAEAFVAFLLLSVTFIYTLWGGISAVHATDKLQLVAVVGFLLALFFTATRVAPDALHVSGSIIKLNAASLTGTLTACLGAFATQFYSILNWGAISRVSRDQQSRLLRRTGFWTSLILSMIILTGVLHPVAQGQSVFESVLQSYSNVRASHGIVAMIVAAVSMWGMTSIVFSTIDSLIIVISQFYMQNLRGIDCRSTVEDPVVMRQIRRSVLVFFGTSVPIFGFFNYVQPNLFQLLLAVLAGVVVFAPLFVSAAIMLSKGDSLTPLGTWGVYGYAVLFLLASLISIVCLVTKSPATSWLGTAVFFTSVLYSIILLATSRARPGTDLVRPAWEQHTDD